MARLESEEREAPSRLELEALGPQEGGAWVRYRLRLQAGRYAITLEPDAALPDQRVVLAADEAAKWAELLQAVAAGAAPKARFEPYEPNFAFAAEATPDGVRVECWLDAGNAWADHYTWDAMGVRFFTTPAALGRFAEALVAEFAGVTA